jgi:uncharacterized Ntn-hydrolase superfamily protein
MLGRVTYSLVARDPETGAMGVAVQSHWFSVGSVVSWARAGVGAVATQSIAQPAHGPNGLDRMAAGESAPEALAGVLASDDLARMRQVGMIDAAGRAAAHTGADCIPYAGHVVGDGFACQANMMARDTVPAAMAAAFEAADGPLADRLIAAMLAAEAEGGDVRGRQSAALLVVPAAGEPWRTELDIRVEDHGDPVGELQRLRRLGRAYELAGEADELLGSGKGEEAGRLYLEASGLAPESDELLFWAGLGIAHAGDLAAGVDAVRRAAAVKPSWLTLLDRLSPEFAPAGEAVRRELGR